MNKAKKNELSLSELNAMREQGLVKDSEAQIAEKRAARAEKKAQKASAEEVRKMFPGFEKTKDYLRYLKHEIRNRRKEAVEKGITSFSLPEELRQPFYLAFQKLDYNQYRAELGDLSIEGLKVQDREVKVFTFHFNDKLLADGFIDFGWIIRMLGKKYVSRYGWALLRNHAALLSMRGGTILGDFFDVWAKDPDTWKKWERLALEDGKPADIRELYPRPV